MRKTITIVLLLLAGLYLSLWRTRPAQTQAAGAVGLPGSAPAPANYSLALNGSGAYAEVPHSESLGLEGPYTVEAWVKTNVTGSQGIVERYNRLGTGEGGFAFRLSPANKLE